MTNNQLLKMIFNRIIRRGLDKANNRFDKRRVIFSNVIFILIFLVSFGALAVASTVSLKILAISTILLTIVFYILNGHYPDVTIKIAGVYMQCLIFIHSGILEPGQSVEYAIIGMTGFIPVFYRNWWSVYFLISNIFIFYYPTLVLQAYEAYFEIAFAPGLIVYFVMLTFVKESEVYEKRLRDKHRQLININKEKNSLIGMVAHDLKSPLNQVKGLVKLLELTEQNVSKEGQEYISRISKSSEKMSKMITQILNAEVLDSKNIILELKSIPPTEVIGEVIHDFELIAKHKNIKISDAVGDEDVKVLADRQCLHQVLQNLVSNAIKFSPSDTNVKLSIEQHNGKVRMKVADQGPGINKEDQAKLFKKFQKLSAKPTAGEDSTGLGLAIVKKFVDAMDGQIWCESEPAKGTTFVIEMNKA